MSADDVTQPTTAHLLVSDPDTEPPTLTARLVWNAGDPWAVAFWFRETSSGLWRAWTWSLETLSDAAQFGGPFPTSEGADVRMERVAPVLADGAAWLLVDLSTLDGRARLLFPAVDVEAFLAAIGGAPAADAGAVDEGLALLLEHRR